MKKISLKKLLFFVLLFSSASSMAQSNYVINLVTTGFKNGTIMYLENRETDVNTDSARIYNGKLVFKGHVSNVTLYRVRTGVVNGNIKYVTLYLENKNITITGNYANFQYSKIEGSEVNKYYIKSRDWQKNYQIERDSLYKIIFSPAGADKELRKKLLTRTNQIDKEVLQYRINFIKKEKLTYFTLHELFYLRNDLSVDSLSIWFNKFPKNLRDTKPGSVILSYINNKLPEVGKHFIDIEGVDIKGVKHKLSDLGGKYVLLDFWASWCGPCRQENPAMLKVYNLYKGKGFEVFSYSTDSNKDNWINEINAEHLNWLNVSDLKGSYSKGAASYQIRMIPQNFLIDPQGIIIAKNVEAADLEKKLKEIYKE